MNNFFRRQVSDAQKLSGVFASLQIFDGILNWLAGFRITEEELKDAGIYLGD